MPLEDWLVFALSFLRTLPYCQPNLTRFPNTTILPSLHDSTSLPLSSLDESFPIESIDDLQPILHSRPSF